MNQPLGGEGEAMTTSSRKLTNTVLYLLRRCPTKPGLTQLLKMVW